MIRRLYDNEIQDLAQLFLSGNLVHPIVISVGEISFSVNTIEEVSFDSDEQMQFRLMTGPDEADAVSVNGRYGWLDLGVGQWSDQPDNAQVILGSSRKELDTRFGQINLNLSLTDGRVVYLVKNLSKDGGSGSIRRLYGGASGVAMQLERDMRRSQLVAALGNGTLFFDDQEWLLVHTLPLHVKEQQTDAVFTEALVQILRYAAQVEHLRHGVKIDNNTGEGNVGNLPRRLSAAERKLIEVEAMMIVRNHLEADGYRVEDVASRESYDFEVRRDKEILYVEVKGTTSRPWSVELTTPEYRVADLRKDCYRMFVVVFENIDHLDNFELVDAGNPVTSTSYEVSPVRYRVRMRP